MAFADTTTPSICIPRVFPNITWNRVKQSIEDADIGSVERVDMVKKTNKSGQPYTMVFVHMKQWGSSPKAFDLRKKLMDGETVTLVYDKPWFWKLLKSNLPKPVFEKKTPTKKHVELMSSSTTMDVIMKQMLEMQKIIALQQQQLNQFNATSYRPPSPLYTPPPKDIEKTFTDMGYDLKKDQSWADVDDDDDICPIAPPRLVRQTAVCDSIQTPTQSTGSGLPNAPKKPKKKTAKKLDIDIEE